MGNKVSPSPDDLPPVEDSYELLCKDGKRKIWCKQWKPNNIEKARCAIYICHGLGEHCMVYDFIAKIWAQKYDALVMANDHMGHGRSEGQPRAYTDSLSTFVSDVHMHIEEAYQKLQKTPEELPLFIFGHSMGGAISLLLARENPKRITGGLMLMGPLIEYSTYNLANLIKYHLTKTIGSILPANMPASPLLYTDCVSEPEQAAEFNKDPLRYHGWIRFGIVRAMFKAVEEIRDMADKFDVPIFLGHGTADKLCCPTAAQIFIDKAASKVKTLKIYQGGAHCLFHEFKSGIRNDLIRDLDEWLHDRMKATGS
ncbi:monoglyceride lipase [Galendromus occidentalis]|uniref:Monoglyceride lipase n=1 Tax=Galendromus occidentalis TaxID=34638 RepID=A0AAJ6QSV9_9ACAR|nr:monoglyceride lipase [Galendromus occidentalis]